MNQCSAENIDSFSREVSVVVGEIIQCIAAYGVRKE